MRYEPMGEAQRQEFHQGTCRHAYRMFGAHHVWQGEEFWHFTVWAPNAQAVSLTGEFCFWDYTKFPMEKQFDGTWELRLPEALFTPQADPRRFSFEVGVSRSESGIHSSPSTFTFFTRSALLKPSIASGRCDSISAFTSG